jgi:protoporphyrinogen oxidase
MLTKDARPADAILARTEVDVTGDVILGGGVSGLAAAVASGATLFEAADWPGGICSSYYIRPGDASRHHQAPADGNAYRFEIGGGHWVFGGDPVVLDALAALVPLVSFVRRSAVFFPSDGLTVPYPLQNNLRFLEAGVAATALAEMARVAPPARTLKQWLESSFGPTLCDLFFHPFHELYTAGLFDRISPQDAYKSPSSFHQAAVGAFAQAAPVGYNATFRYPDGGLDRLAAAMAGRCDLHYGKRAVGIDLDTREVAFADGTSARYRRLLSTLPLPDTLAMAGLAARSPADPHTSVLVLNLGVRRGARFPAEQWLYVPSSAAGFHRVGIYSNVDDSFLPRPVRGRGTHGSLYVERSFHGTPEPGGAALARYTREVIEELQAWQFIGEVEAADPTWIPVAYTWSWPGSGWRGEAMRLLESRGVYPLGRYGRWVFQGIADSVRDGLFAGAAMRAGDGPVPRIS